MRNPATPFTTALAGAALLAAGCLGRGDTDAVASRPDAVALDEPVSARVRVVNAVPGARLDLWAGDSVAFRRVAYARATGYREIPQDQFAFSIRSGGRKGEVLAEHEENLENEGRYTLLALPARLNPEGRTLRLLDDALRAPDPARARIRFVNAVVGEPPVDVFLRGRDGPLFEDVEFTTAPTWMDVEPDVGTVVIRPDGRNVTLASLENALLEGGNSYTLVLAGSAGEYELVWMEEEK